MFGRRPKGLPKKIPAWAWKWLRWRVGKKPAPKPPKPPTPPLTKIYMFDDINVSLIPKNAQAVAGYVDGKWATWSQIYKLFPRAKKISIAVFPKDNADCLDVEPGDAGPAQAPAWVRRQQSLGKKRPILYTNASHGQGLVNICAAAGLVYGKDYLWWSAHYDPAKGEHLCGPSCGFGLKVIAHATQFTDHALSKSLDESVCGPGFFN